MDSEGEISKVKDDLNETLIGVLLADINLYFSESTSCKDRSRVEAKDTGLTSVSDLELVIMVASPCRTSSCIIISNILGVGSAIAGERGATNP